MDGRVFICNRKRHPSDLTCVSMEMHVKHIIAEEMTGKIVAGAIPIFPASSSEHERRFAKSPH